MKIHKTIVQRFDDGAVLSIDTIEHEGKLWLVPDWIAGPSERTERPRRIICVDGLALEKPGSQYKADWVLLMPLSTATLEGGTAQGLVVIESPDLFRPAPHVH